MKYIISSFTFLLMLAALHSCKEMPNDGIPFYLKVDTVSVLEKGSSSVYVSHRITDIWAEANSTNLGIYELPCNFPVLEENEVRVILTAGVEESGQSGVRVVYPFYLPDTFTLNAVRGEKYPRSPVFQYRGATNFALIEDFEAGSIFDSIEPAYYTNANSAYYGLRYGILNTHTDSNKLAKQIAGNTPMTLTVGQEAWLELDYKSEVPFYVGLYANYTSSPTLKIPVLFVTPSAEWNKIYVKLNEMVGYARGSSYQIYFEALRPYGSSGGTVFFDNVRLVHFL